MPVSVLVVDDSALMRKKLREILHQDPEIRVVDTAPDGETAVRKACSLPVDVVTMDLEMPGNGGLWAIREILRQRAVPIVVVSSLAQPQARATVEALLAGAVACVAKPSGSISLDLERQGEDIRREVRRAALARPRAFLREPAGAAGADATVRLPLGEADGRWDRLLLVAASTGGPGALAQFFASLPPSPRTAAVVVQHMPRGFTAALAEHLDRVGPFSVREAQDGESLRGGVALVAPGGTHLLLRPPGRVALDDTLPPEHGVRPAADVTFRSAALLPVPVGVVVLTGMGTDGALGAELLARKGAVIMAQDGDSAVVDGMPRAVRGLGIARVVDSPGALGRAAGRWAQGEALA